LLLAGGNGIEEEARRILDAFAGRPHVFNLGHGIDKDTPVANVERLLAAVRGWRG
jgi:uroporphyrinogen decarboxylase